MPQTSPMSWMIMSLSMPIFISVLSSISMMEKTFMNKKSMLTVTMNSWKW